MRLCKLCSSPNRAEADERLLRGETARTVAGWLTEAGEVLSASAVARHARNHVRAPAAEVAVSAAAEKIADDAAALEELAVRSMRLVRTLSDRVIAGGRSVTTAEATAFVAACRTALSAVVARAELLTGKKVKVEATLGGGLAGLYAELERRDAEARARNEEPEH